MSVAVLDVLQRQAGRRLPPVGQTGRYVRTAEACLTVQRESVEAVVADQLQTAFAVADRVVGPANPTALAGNDVQRRKLSMADSLRRFDELLRPGGRFVLFDKWSDECVFGDGGGSVEVTTVGGPPKRCAEVRKVAGKPVIGLALPRTVPQRDDIGFQAGEESRVRIAGCLRKTIGDELIFGELPDRLQHRESCSPG